MGLLGLDLPTLVKQLPFFCGQKSHDGLERGALAGAIATEQYGDSIGFCFKGDTLENMVLSDEGMNIFRF